MDTMHASNSSLSGLTSKAGARPNASAVGQPVNTDNYGRVADDLRRDLRVAQVVCLDAT